MIKPDQFDFSYGSINPIHVGSDCVKSKTDLNEDSKKANDDSKKVNDDEEEETRHRRDQPNGSQDEDNSIIDITTCSGPFFLNRERTVALILWTVVILFLFALVLAFLFSGETR